MNRFINNLTPVRNWRWARDVKTFIQSNVERGVILRDRDVPRALAAVRTVVMDSAMVMEGQSVVRVVAAPLEACDPGKFRRQSSWMLLAAGVALGCEGYAPLEGFARELNFEKERMLRQYPQVAALPYDDVRRLETTVHRDAGGLRAYTKGDPEAVLAGCAQVLDGRERPLTDEDREKARMAVRQMEDQGLLTLAFATRWREEPGPYEEGMAFLGVVGMGDMARPETFAIVDTFRGMGIHPVLITESSLPDGTIRASGILEPGETILRGGDLEALEGMALRGAVQGAGAFLEVRDAARGRLMRVLRGEGTVAQLTQTSEGGVTVSLGRGAVGEAFIPDGGPKNVAVLIAACRELVDTHQPR